MAAPNPWRVILFDIDGTLLDTGGAGLRALRQALPEAFPHLDVARMPELDLAGSTDSGLAMEVFRSCGLEDTPANRKRYFDAYLRHLRGNLSADDSNARLLPGVADLLTALGGCENATHATGLLTGNIREGAALKVGHFALDASFAFGAYGDDHHDRNRLGPIARARAERHLGASVDVAASVVIGDTPKDILCGKALGARTLAVATGSFDIDVLRGFGADLVFETLEDTEAVLRALLDGIP